MIGLLNEKAVVAFAPASNATNATASSDPIDTLGYRSMRVSFVGAKVSASNLSNALTTLKIQHASASNGTFSDFTSATWSFTTNTTAAASEFTVASTGVTTLPFLIEIHANGILGTNGLQRWLRTVHQTPTGNNTNAVIVALDRGDQSPNTDAEAGAWRRVVT